MKEIPTQTACAFKAYVVLLFLSAVCCSCGSRETGPQPANKTRITIASGVRLRSAPAGNADEVAKLPLGVVLRELEQSSNQDKVGGVEDYWFRIATPEGQEGWVFGGFAAPFEQDRRAEIYRKIADERLQAKDATFADYTDLVRFLTDAVAEVKQPEAAAELELARLLAMKQTVEKIPFEKQEEPPYKDWLEANEDSLAYSEPAGQWLVRSDLFWELQKKYSALPIAEKIAWEGAKNGLPGECEGYVPCYLGTFNQTDGKYLDLYPDGAYADKALSEMEASLTEVVPTVLPQTPDGQESAEAREELKKLRATVNKTSHDKKAAVLKLLDELQAHYR